MYGRAVIAVTLVSAAAALVSPPAAGFKGDCPAGGYPRLTEVVAPNTTARATTRGLRLWLEGETLAADPFGVVTSWPDMRGLSVGQVRAWRRNDGSRMTGALTTAQLPVVSRPAPRRTVNALRCSETPRCSYVFANPPIPGASGAAGLGSERLGVLNGMPYAIFAVAKRASDRGDQYVVMTEGSGCDTITGINCAANTALHLGWNGNDSLRLDQYGAGTEAVMGCVPTFYAPAPELSLLVGRSEARGLSIGLVERLAVASRTSDRTPSPMANTNRLFVGGTRWADNNPTPNWYFVGDIFAVLIYDVRLTDAERNDVIAYLRAKYGPA